MAKARKVKADVVGKEEKKGKKSSKGSSKGALGFLSKAKLAVAIILDAIDLVLANIPILNTLWDFVTFAVLMATLKNKWLAGGAFAELPFAGIPLLGQIDAFLPIATIMTLVDIAESKLRKN